MNVVKVLGARIAVAAGLFLLSALSGVALRLLGRPPSPALLAVHKLTAVASLVLTVIAVYAVLKSARTGLPASALMVAIGLLFVLLFVSGALLSADKPANVVLRAVHMAAPLVVAGCAVLLWWLHRPTGIGG